MSSRDAQGASKLDCVFIFLPSSPLVPDPSQERERTKLKGSRDKREVTTTTTIHYFDFVPQDFPPVPNSVLGAFHFLSFDSQKVKYIYKDYLYRRAIIFRFARRRWRLATIPGRYSTVVIYLLPKREREKHKSILEQKMKLKEFVKGGE